MFVIAGEKSKKEYIHVNLENIIGKTVESVRMGEVESNYGKQPCIYFCFTNGTMHGVVLSNDKE